MKLSSVDDLLRDAEWRVGLLARCRALNLRQQVAHVHAAWRAGWPVAPELIYAPKPDLSRIRECLEAVQVWASHYGGGWGELYAERANELEREARLAERVGVPEFWKLAALRFPVESGLDAKTAERWVSEWCLQNPDEEDAARCRSDDERDPCSLVACLRRAVGTERIPWRVEVSRSLLSVAATGYGVILVRERHWHSPRECERIVEHEIAGHVLPRSSAQREPLGLFRIGSAGSADDEEGRALLIERRAGLQGNNRRRELAWRHLAALAVRDGADWQQVVRLLVARGAPLAASLDVAFRVLRGGGLGRELVYLPALSRVQRHLDTCPELEQWMMRGRIGVQAAARLRLLQPFASQSSSSRAA